MMRFAIGEKWGGGEGNAAAACGCIFEVPEGWQLVQHDGGGQAIYPIEALTEMKPACPPEPEPGAYLIGETICVHPPAEIDSQWFLFKNGDHRGWRDWPTAWLALGGPDVTITRLVALPEVELPWRSRDENDCAVEVRTGFLNTVIDRTSDAAGDLTSHAYNPESAEAKAHALLSAARAVRSKP